MADFTNYISSYGKEVGLPSLALNEQGVCSLTFDGKINVFLRLLSAISQVVIVKNFLRNYSFPIVLVQKMAGLFWVLKKKKIVLC